MKKVRGYITSSFITGIIALSPIAIIFFIFKWVYGLITERLRPITNIIIASSNLYYIVANILAFVIIMLFCLIVGAFVRTRFGNFIHSKFEDRILKVAPGYSIIKETLMQFLGKRKNPFSSVALVRIFSTNALMTAFVTDTHPDGSYTVFVPTGPNPTSGNIYHLKKERVFILDIGLEAAMQSIISCGAGSTPLIEAFSRIKKKEKKNGITK